MAVYHDMANDAGERYGTQGNEQLAAMAEADHRRMMEEQEAADDYEYELYLEEMGYYDMLPDPAIAQPTLGTAPAANEGSILDGPKYTGLQDRNDA